MPRHIITREDRDKFSCDLHEIFCETLLRVRNELGFSQNDLAKRMGVGRAYIADIERGRNNPTIALVERCARGLRVSPAILVQRHPAWVNLSTYSTLLGKRRKKS